VSVTAGYYRVKVENTSASPQIALSLEATVSLLPRMSIPTSRVAQTQSDYSDVLSVRDLTDIHLDESRGLHAGRTTVHKFGRNPSVDASTVEDIWAVGGSITWLTAAAAVRVKSGGSTDDTAAGSGARSITIVGLDENWAEASETVATAGASASSATTTTFIRVFRAYVATAGSYTGANAAAVVIETTGGVVMATISRDGSDTVGLGQTQICAYTVPAGKVGWLRLVEADVDSGKSATMLLWQRQNADTTSAPVVARRLVHAFGAITGLAELRPIAPIGPFPAKTDIWMSGTGPAGGAAMSGRFELILTDAL